MAEETTENKYSCVVLYSIAVILAGPESTEGDKKYLFLR